MPVRPTRPTVLLAVLLALGWIAAGRVARAAGAEYVALGDSYSSGLGTGGADDGPCRRSSAAFPHVVAAARPGTTLTSVACAGATVADVLDGQVAALSTTTGLVTVTVGGNDAGFSRVLARCALPMWVARCAPPVRRARAFALRALPGRLDRLFAEIRRRAPTAVVVVAGYPRLFNGEDCGPVTFFSRGDQRLLDGAAELLRDVTRRRAVRAGFRFADVVPAFRGHAVCDAEEWLNGLSHPLRESFHPNATGHADGYAPAVLRAAG